MAFVNYFSNDVSIKIVYYGPGLSGKTTNLKHIAQKLDPASRGDFICFESRHKRTYFFDLLLIKAGLIGDFKLHFQLVTSPGQVFYESPRRSVLKGIDGLVFVADSQTQLLDANLESYNSLRRHFEEMRVDLDALPLVFQYNKRDLDDLISVEKLNNLLNSVGRPYFEASAINGRGVFETLRGIVGLTIPVVKHQLMPEAEEGDLQPQALQEKVDRSIIQEGDVAAPAAATEAPRAAAESRAEAGLSANPEPKAAGISAEETISRDIKKIKFKSEKDIEKELDILSREFRKKT